MPKFLELLTNGMKTRAGDMGNRDDRAALQETAAFLAEYASLQLGCGSTCIRIEKNTRRMAEAFGMDLGIFIMPDTVTV